MSVASDWWVLLHGTPLSPSVWDGVGAHLGRRGDPVDPDAALGRWFTEAELNECGPVVRYARSRVEHADRRSWALALEAIARYDRSDRVPAIGAPVTLIAAELDQVSAPAAMSALASRLPQASLTILPGAAHMSPFADPAALAGLIVRGRPD